MNENIKIQSVINCAHRGARAYEPENTIRAFVRAAGMGASQVELDVRLTADGIPIVSHDAYIKTVPYGTQLDLIEFEELKKLRYKGESVPSLDESVEACLRNGLTLNIEIKEAEASEKVAEIFGRRDLYEGSHVSSFSLEALRRVRKADPRIPLGLLAKPGMQGAALKRAIDEGYQAVNSFFRTTSARFVQKAKSSGIKVNVWTVNNPSDMARFIALGVDSVITDYPDAMSEALKAMKNIN